MININNLQIKLAALKIPGAVADIKNNDFYTDIYINFNPDITISKIKARKSDLELFLQAAVNINYDSGYVVLRVQKDNRGSCNTENFYNIIQDKKTALDLPLIIGKNENGAPLVYDLTRFPHLLIGGSTGSGKSVYIHNCILSHIFRGGDSSLVLVDVKKVEFSIYEGIPHLATPVVYDCKTALKVFKALCNEMDSRYDKLKSVNCRNIKEYHDAGHKMNYYTIIIDELADLLMGDKRLEPYIIRIAQLGRAAGLHLIIATQRPDSVVLSGLIRSNIPTRICFAVQKATDSRIILDRPGGETLRGAGDGLLCMIGDRDPVRFQAPFITTESILDIVNKARRAKVIK